MYFLCDVSFAVQYISRELREKEHLLVISDCTCSTPPRPTMVQKVVYYIGLKTSLLRNKYKLSFG